jgi:hypothetical protein
MIKVNGNRICESVSIVFSGGPEVLYTPCFEETCSVGIASGRLVRGYHDYTGRKV